MEASLSQYLSQKKRNCSKKKTKTPILPLDQRLTSQTLCIKIHIEDLKRELYNMDYSVIVQEKENVSEKD